MAAVTVRLQGFTAIEKKLLALPTKVARKVASPAMRAGAKVIQGEAKRLAPVGGDRMVPQSWATINGMKFRSAQRVKKKGGSLQKSIRVRMAKKRKRGQIMFTVTTSKDDNIFKGDEFYGGFQEMGYRVGKRSSEVTRLQKGVSKARAARNTQAIGRAQAALSAADGRRHIPGKFFMRRAAKNRGKMAVDVVGRELVAGIMREAKTP